SQTPVQIDDADVYSPTNRNGIQFSSEDWNSTGRADPIPHFNGTYTQTRVSGASLIFFFRGSAIAYFVDIGPHRGYVLVSVDNVIHRVFNADNPTVEYQQPMFFIDGLDSGDHQILIDNLGPEVDANNTIAGLDYFQVTPNDNKAGIRPVTLGPGASSIPDTAVVVDDNDPSITYSGQWVVMPSAPRSAFYFQDTMHSTKSVGDSCTFNFTGTAVWYFTDYFTNNPAVNISVDGGPSETVITASAGSIG
ncbi:hypothetical protein FRC06_008840, partial [Ceratobasidium sp. 370]